MTAYFIAGTDTDVGKTLVSCALLLRASQAGIANVGLKPVAAGCEQTADGLRNEDALAMMASMSEPLSYEQVNPVALALPVAPHIAAQQANAILDLDSLVTHCRSYCEAFPFVIIEGAGGWRMPLNSPYFLSDLAVSLELPVILVVGLRLGCLNHAQLTLEAIHSDGLHLAGWVANQIQPDLLYPDANLATLTELMGVPPLSILPYQPQVKSDDIAALFDCKTLF